MPDQPESADSNNVAQFQPESRDVDTNFVLNNLNSPEMNPIDLGRNEKLRLISSNLPENIHPFAAKQMMLAQRKSVQQQTNWQSVKPTMIQMSQREVRPNRQADLNQVEDTSGEQSQADLGIQMRTPMSQRRKDQQQLLLTKPSSGQVIKQTNSLPNLNNQQQQQQQQREDDVRFEQQQQNQMVDYSEESEPEFENNLSNNATIGVESDDQGRVGQQPTGGRMSGEGIAVNSVDSSSSSMMLEPQKPREFKQQQPVAANESTMSDRSKQQGDVTQVDSIRKKTQSDDKPTTNGPIESQRGSELSQSTMESSTMPPSTTTRMSTPASTTQSGNDTTTAQRQQKPVSKVQQSGTMQTTTPAIQKPSSSSNKMNDISRDGTSLGAGSTSIAATPLTSTSAPTTSMGPRFVMSTANDDVDLNETPISMTTEADQSTIAKPREQRPSKSTTPTGRVELENGRPATGNRQMATTTSARLPTKPTTTGSSSTTSKKGSSTIPALTTNTTPIPTPITQGVRQNDGMSSAQPGMRTVSATSTSRPRQGTEPTLLTVNASVNDTPTQSPNPTTETTTTTGASAGSSSEATDSPNSENEEDSDDEEDESTTSSANEIDQSKGNNTTSNDSTSGDSDDSSDDSSASSETESEQGQTTTVPTPTTTTTGSAITQSSMQTTISNKPVSSLTRSQTLVEPKITTTTQQPALTTIDIERLPAKATSGSKSTTPGMRMVMMRTTTSSTPSSSTPADISRIIRPTSTTSSSSIESTSPETNQQQRQDQMPNDNLIMMKIDQTRPDTIDGETAITMPIDTLMKMMMMNQILREDNEPRGSTMPIVSPDQTTQSPTTASSDFAANATGSSSVEQSSQTTPAQSTSVLTGEQSETSSTAMPKKNKDEDERNNLSQGTDAEATGMIKKKLQPPPTTRQPSPSKAQSGDRSNVETGRTNEMSSSTASQSNLNLNPSPTTTTTSPTIIEADGPTQKTMFVNFEPSSNSMMDIASDGRAEPKIDLIHLDLLPIQRIMNTESNKLNDKLRINNGTTPKSTSQLSMEQQQQAANEIVRGSQTPMQKMDQLMPEVEPGMRLRPPIGMAGVVMRESNVGGMQTNNGQVIGSIKTGVNNPSNTIYTIMTSGSSSPAQQQGKAHSKKPVLMTTADQRTVTSQAPVKNTAFTMSMSGRSTSQTQKEIADMMTMMRKNELSDKQGTSSRPGVSSADFGTVTTMKTTTTRAPASFEMEQQKGFNTTTNTTSGSQSPTSTMRPLLTSSATSPSRSSTTFKQQEASSSTVPNFMTRATGTVATTTSKPATIMTTITATPTQATPTSRNTEGEPLSRSMKETTNLPSSLQTPVDNQQQVDNLRNYNNTNNRFDRIQQQAPETRRPQQQMGTKTGKLNQQQALNKASNSNLTSSFIPPKLRTDFNKFSSLIQTQQPAGMNEKLIAPQKNTTESVRQSSTGSVEQNARAVSSTTTQSPSRLTNGMIQNMAIRQFGGANRMSALTNQPIPFGRPSAMIFEQQQPSKHRFELPSFEYGPSIAVRRPDEPLANGQIPNCTLTGKNFCVLTKDYPMNEVRQAVERSFRSVRIMYEELQTVSDQELHKDDFNSTNNQAASGKFACQTQVEMMRPGWAKDEITKEWMLVVNTDVFPQRVRTESCAQPNTPCEFIAPFYDSTCQQRYSLHRMIAIDPHDPTRSPQVAVFKFPAGCVCRVHPIRKTTTATMLAQTSTSVLATTPSPVTIISSSTSKSIRKRR